MYALKHNNLYAQCGEQPLLCSGRVLSDGEMYELLAAAVFMYMKREQANKDFLNQERYYLCQYATCNYMKIFTKVKYRLYIAKYSRPSLIRTCLIHTFFTKPILMILMAILRSIN